MEKVTKTSQIKALLIEGKTRKEVSEILEIGYGFVQNVFAKTLGVAKTNVKKYSYRFKWNTEINGINRKGALCKYKKQEKGKILVTFRKDNATLQTKIIALQKIA